MATMKTSEVQAFARNATIAELGLDKVGTQCGAGTFYVPQETPENGIVFTKVVVTCTKFNATEKIPAFDLETAIAKQEALEAEKARKAAEKAEEAAKAAASK